MSSKPRASTGDTEEKAEKDSPHKKTISSATSFINHAVTDDDGVDESMDDGNVDSEDGSLMIAEMQEGKDTDDTERESGHSDEDEHAQLIFNGTMTRRQSKQFQDAGGNFAVFSVRVGGKTKNRTCEYCGVVKATPAALVRHIRKHTGEKPFVCQLCGKAYKAKRSLHLHQNSHHKEMGQMLPPNPSSLPTFVPVQSPVLAQTSPTPAISEVTKSLLRETLESSRKARDGSTGNQTPESFNGTNNPQKVVNDRLPTPNLVNLLTSDISRKVQNVDEPVCLVKGVINLSKTSDASTNYMVSQSLVKKETDEEVIDNVDEEQAEDLSMQTMQKSVSARQSSLETRLKCELCNKSFKHDISRTNHMRTAHNIIVSISGTPQAKHSDSFTLIEQKPSSNTTLLPHVKHEPANHNKQEALVDLSILNLHSRKLNDSSSGHVSQGAVKVEPLLAGSTESLLLDESDTLPYNVTSRMVQDTDVEKLIIKGIEKSVLAEDGGNRRLRMTITRETVLATRLDGINNITGRQATVFKCHLCARVFSSMLRFHNHLPSHFDAEVQTFDCRYCEAAFRSLSQIVKHLQCHREKFTGMNQTGTGLNSSALLLEEFHRKQKPDQHVGNSTVSSSPASLFSPTLHSDESLSGTPQLEPGERANGGYTCVKCRKSFSREYLLQRHMRIHQNQNMFYCPECESGFSGEMDMIDHHRKVHEAKPTELLQYSSLLKNFNESKQMSGCRQAFISDNNNNNSSGGVQGSNVFSLVDMKAFDLRRGEAVDVRVTSESDLSREALVQHAILERYKVLMMAAKDNEHIRQALASASAAAEELRKRKLEGERKQEAEEEARKTKEFEKRRKMEHEKLIEKLAQEGMGDVTVVLPDAPPPDDTRDMTGDIDRPTDLSVTGEPPSAIGFMARKATPKSSLPVSRINLQADGPQESKTTTNNLVTAESLKRPLNDTADPSVGFSSKSRRKAHKPQKIKNQSEKVELVVAETGEDRNNNKTAITSFSYPNLEGIYQNMKVSKLSYGIVVGESSSVLNNNNGAIDLTTDSKDPQAKLPVASLDYQASKNVAVSSSSSSTSSSSSPPVDGGSKQEQKGTNFCLTPFTHSISLDSDNSQSLEITSAADLSKTSLLTIQIPAGQDGLVGNPQVQWKPGNPWPADMSESLLGVINGGQWNGKRGKPLSCTSKSRTSSPSPVPSPTNSDASSSAEGRKITTTSLSRTHSRLSIVNEPLDRNSLCKPQVLDDGRSVYTCVICHKQFLSLSDINRHMDFHEDIRPYKCKYCDYYARTNSQLKVHKLRHEGVREFCCRVCNYKGVTQSDLNRHMKSQVHLLRSNHVCSQCGEGFVTPKTLRDHICCTSSAEKSFENSTNEIDDDPNNDEYEDGEIMNSETS